MTEKTTDFLVQAAISNGLDITHRRIIMIGDMELLESSGNNPVELAIRGLLYLDSTPGKIELWLDTPGGNVDEMFALYDVIRTRDNEITTVGFGTIASAGALILAAGDKRKCTENCWYMTHAMSPNVEGDLHTAKLQLQISEQIWDRWSTLMAKHSKPSKKWWAEAHLQNRELWWNAKQMLSNRIIDEVIPNQEAV